MQSVLLLLLATTALSAAQNVLMLGGSPSASALTMDAMMETMLAEQGTESSVVVNAVTAPNKEGNLTELLLAGDVVSQILGQRPWKYVVVQEGREVPGYFPPDDNDSREDMWDVSVSSVLNVYEQVQEKLGADAMMVFLQTPAYVNGSPDNYNRDIYESYEEMQEALEDGYRRYYREVEKVHPRAQMRIAPCGLAFQEVYNEDRALFDQLYEKDGKTPSQLGDYLCAAVLVQTMTGQDVRSLVLHIRGVNESGTYLKSVAHRTVVEYHNGGQPAKQTKRYRPAGEQKRTRWSGIFRLFCAVLVGGGVVLGFVASKWYTAGQTIHGMQESGYQLLPDNGLLMELMENPPQQQQSDQTEPQWINPV